MKSSIQASVGKASHVLSFEAVMKWSWASQVALVIKNPSAIQEMQETRVQSLGQEDPLE